MPVNAGQETSLAVTRAKGPGFFGVRVVDGGALEVAIWKSAHVSRCPEPARAVHHDARGRLPRLVLCAVLPHEPVLLEAPDGRKDPIVVTFDRDLVRAVWLITHQRGAQRESFLIVMKDSSDT